MQIHSDEILAQAARDHIAAGLGRQRRSLKAVLSRALRTLALRLDGAERHDTPVEQLTV